MVEGMPAVAMTDHGVLFGAVEFVKTAKAVGVKPILGCEVYQARGSRHDRKAGPLSSRVTASASMPVWGDDDVAVASQKTESQRNQSNHLVLLAENETGYVNLMKLVTLSHLEGFYYKPRIDRELLDRYRGGLIGLSACLKGRVAERILAGDTQGAMRAAGEYAEILGKGNFYLEIQENGLEAQRRVNAGLIEIAGKTGLPLVATNDVHYLDRSHAGAHEIMLCLQTATVMSDPHRLRYETDQFHMTTAADMVGRFKDRPDALANTLEIAHRCNVKFDFETRHYPRFQSPDGRPAREHMERLCREGLRTRYGIVDPDHPRDEREARIVQQCRYELGIIEKTGFADYFLVVWDFIRFARENRIPVGPGRGSGAGSMVSYLMGITGVDPLRYHLVFERFLNPERVSPPDFDIDFCQARRGEVIDYVREKYGRENVAQIITFGAILAKTAIRDVGRVLGVPLAVCDRLAKMVPDIPKISFAKAMEENPELRFAYENDPDAKRIMDYAFVLEGVLRNEGVHAAGVVIAEKPLFDLIPLTREKNGEILTQYSKDHIEALGLLKADFLGLQTLTVIEETLTLIREYHQVELDLSAIPLDDVETYQMLKRGDSIAVFQLESKGMRELLRRFAPDRIEDLIALIALFRPGPMKVLDEFVDRKHGRIQVTYDHPLLEPILAETQGLMIYQEQVQQAAQILAGYSLGQGDLLRRAMSKKKTGEMEEQRESFIKGCWERNRIPREIADGIFSKIAAFAEYGFNKSHSTCYGVITYQTAYLKAHYPVEYMAAVLSNDMGNTDKLPIEIAEAREMDIAILPPDINTAQVRFRPENGKIRFGLAGIKNVGYGAAEAIVKERLAGGPYRSLVDLCLRLDARAVNRKILETLAQAGALDAFGRHRAQVFQAIPWAMSCAESRRRDRATGQGHLFENLGQTSDRSISELPDCAPWPQSEQLRLEKELLGAYISGHPLAQYESLLARYRSIPTSQIQSLAHHTLTRIGGILSRVERRKTREKKEDMASVTIEDMEGSVEGVLFPDYYESCKALIQEGALVLAGGEVFRPDTDGKTDFRIYELHPLDQAPALFTRHVSLRLASDGIDETLFEKMRACLNAHPGPILVVLCLEYPGGQKVYLEADESFRVFPDDRFIRDMEHIIGEGRVYVAVDNRPCRNGGRRPSQPGNGPRVRNG